MRISAALPTGVAALLFDAARRRRRLEARLVGKMMARGFSEVILPVLDYFEPYEPILSSSTREELYRFVDRDGQLLALRSDFTPMLARLLVPRLPFLEKPVRLFYCGDVVRYQEPRPGRLREYYQLGAELLGSAREAADEEMLGLFVELLSSTVEGSLQIVLGFAGALDPLLRTAHRQGEDVAGLIGGVARRQREVARRGGPPLLEIVENGVPQEPEELGPEAAPQLMRILSLQDRLRRKLPGERVELTVDLAEFASNTLDPALAAPEYKRTYYDGIIFKAYQVGDALPVASGGRYDGIFHVLGAEVPAVGFSISLDRLLEGGKPGAGAKTDAEGSP